MEFDTEIMVRLFWRGVPVIESPVKVIYPPGNTSNFHLWRENWRISCMHARLFCAMLLTFPKILLRRPAGETRHWATLNERGARWGLAIWAMAYRLLGRRGCLVVMAPVVLYFYLTGSEQRRASREFLARVCGRARRSSQPGFWDGFRHFMSFAGRVVDSFAGWIGQMKAGDVVAARTQDLDAAMASPRGAVIVVSHLGNVELARALMSTETRDRLLVLVHTRHAENFNRLLRTIGRTPQSTPGRSPNWGRNPRSSFRSGSSRALGRDCRRPHAGERGRTASVSFPSWVRKPASPTGLTSWPLCWNARSTPCSASRKGRVMGSISTGWLTRSCCRGAPARPRCNNTHHSLRSAWPKWR